MQGTPESFKSKPCRFVWEYRNPQGEPIGYVDRLDADISKEKIIPYSKRISGCFYG